MENNKKLQKIDKELLQRVLNVFECSYDLTTDSRKVKQGSVFVALRGDNFDGNAFAGKALEQGASLVVIDNEDYYQNEKTILVEDSLVFLQKFANYYRKTFSIPFLAISGTNGKTTTKELVNAVLSTKFKVSATIGNLNNQIGVPLTLLNIKRDIDVAVVEMGASRLKDIEFLCEIAEPTCGLLTNVGTAHIEGFGSLQGVVQTKTELYRFLNGVNGKVFVNNDDENLFSQEVKNKTTYALRKDAEVKASFSNLESPFAEIELEDNVIKSNLIGSYNAYNILAAITVGKYFGVSMENMKKAIETYKPENHRSEIKETEKNTLILDCYNANASSCRFALNAFNNITADDKRVYIGAMKELGSVSEQEHKAIADIIKSMNLKQAIFVGEEYKVFATGENIHWFATSDEAKAFVEKENVSKAFILIKGSRATQMEKLADVL